MFEQAELRRNPTWALLVRLLQKERLKSPQKSLFYRKPGLLGHFGHFGKTDTPGQGLCPRGHGHLFDKKIVGVFVSLI